MTDFVQELVQTLNLELNFSKTKKFYQSNRVVWDPFINKVKLVYFQNLGLGMSMWLYISGTVTPLK